MSSAYIRSLQRRLEAETVPLQQPAPDLKSRFIEWFNSVPRISRYRPFAMIELETALRTQGRHLSPILLSLGWTRKRNWTARGQNNRYWVPPGLD